MYFSLHFYLMKSEEFFSSCHASAAGTAVRWYAVDSLVTRQMSLLKRKLITMITLFTPAQLSLADYSDQRTDGQTYVTAACVCAPRNKISHCDARPFITALVERSVATRDKLHSWATVRSPSDADGCVKRATAFQHRRPASMLLIMPVLLDTSRIYHSVEDCYVHVNGAGETACVHDILT